MKLQRLRLFLLLAALLAGQWVAVAHAVDHAALEPAGVLCTYCVSGGSPGPLPATWVPTLQLVQAQPAPEFIAAAAPGRAALGSHLIRGPPLLVC